MTSINPSDNIHHIQEAIDKINSGAISFTYPSVKENLLHNLTNSLAYLTHAAEKQEKELANNIAEFISEYTSTNPNICAVNITAYLLKLLLLSDTLAPNHVHWLELKEALDKILMEVSTRENSNEN